MFFIVLSGLVYHGVIVFDLEVIGHRVAATHRKTSLRRASKSAIALR